MTWDDDEEHALARSTDPQTSHDAAETVDVGKLQRIIVDTLLAHPENLTTVGISLLNPMYARDSISPRMWSLEAKGLVFRAGTDINPSGRTAIAWSAYPPTNGTSPMLKRRTKKPKPDPKEQARLYAGSKH